MNYPDAKQRLSRHQPYIRAAHRARSQEMHRLASIAGRSIRRTFKIVLSPLARAGQSLMDGWRVRQAEKQLAAMDDRMLTDLGISRADIRRVVRNGRQEPENVGMPEMHPHEAKRSAEVVNLREERDVMGALILHGPWSHYTERGRKRNDAA